MDIPRKKNINDHKENNSFQEVSEENSKIYDFLDRKLEKENADSFSLGFSKNIIRKIEAKQQRQLNAKIYILVFFLILVSFPLFISFLNTEFISMLFSVFLQNKFIVAFLLFGVILVQFGERLIRFMKDIR